MVGSRASVSGGRSEDAIRVDRGLTVHPSRVGTNEGKGRALAYDFGELLRSQLGCDLVVRVTSPRTETQKRANSHERDNKR